MYDESIDVSDAEEVATPPSSVSVSRRQEVWGRNVPSILFLKYPIVALYIFIVDVAEKHC